MDSDDDYSCGDDYSYDHYDYGYDDNSYDDNDYESDNDTSSVRSSSWDYYYDWDSDDDNVYRSPQTTSYEHPPEMKALISFAYSVENSLEKPSPFKYFPNQKDRKLMEPSFIHLIENLLEESMSDPFALSMIDYGIDRNITYFLDILLEDIDGLSYTDTSSGKHDLPLSYKKLVICMTHLMRQKHYKLYFISANQYFLTFQVQYF